MLNIVIPMAGAGSRFSEAGFKDPKPLIPVHNMPMIQLIIENLRPLEQHRFIFICQRKHVQLYGLHEKLNDWAPDCKIVEIDGMTEGAACTVLAAAEYINNDSALMIANSDQYVDLDINIYLNNFSNKDIDGLIMTMHADDPKWSFVGLEGELVTRVVEKEVISNEATVGIYNFRHGSSFVKAANEMIDLDQRVKGEFYVAPTYNSLIKDGQKIGIYNIGREGDGMYGLGIPADLKKFLLLDVSQKLCR
jgi:dTDP-glucose pyrophosphorylase